MARLEKLRLHSMASGHLRLELTEAIEWHEFAQFANEFAAMIHTPVGDKFAGMEMIIWFLQFPTCQMRLVFDDFPVMVSLESDTVQGDDILRNLAADLKGK